MPYIYRQCRPQHTMDRMWRELWLASRGLERFARRNALIVDPQGPPRQDMHWAEVVRVTNTGVMQLAVYSITHDRFVGKVSIQARHHA